MADPHRASDKPPPGWGEDPPYRRLGRAAVEAAGLTVGLGNSGAGLGASAGGLEGGLGSASVVQESGVTVGALAVVNSLGSVAVKVTPYLSSER